MITKRVHGTTRDYREQVMLYTLTAGEYEMSVSTYGATIVDLIAPDAFGRRANIVLGYRTFEEYERGTRFFGAMIGRVANRIRGGTFSIGEATYHVPCNERGVNALHGGAEGLHTRLWNVLTSEVDGAPAVHLSYITEAGENGFPGTLKVHVDYILYPEGRLEITCAAICDQITPVSLTNHSYFNLAGDGNDVLDHELRLRCDRYLPVDDSQIPTGEILPVKGTLFDFTRPKRIGKEIFSLQGGYDHCMVLAEEGDHLKEFAYVTESKTGRTMRVSTTMEAVQFYSGNHLDGTDKARDGNPYTQYAGFCLETQHYPDAVNHAHFPSSLVHPGETYKHTTLFEFNV